MFRVCVEGRGKERDMGRGRGEEIGRGREREGRKESRDRKEGSEKLSRPELRTS